MFALGSTAIASPGAIVGVRLTVVGVRMGMVMVTAGNVIVI
jgi:hypothetical protein